MYMVPKPIPWTRLAVIISLATNPNDLFFRFYVALGICFFSTSFELFQAVVEVKMLTQAEIQTRH